MQGKYVPRQLEQELRECLLDFPVVALLGPRQCGKSTLAKALIKDRDDAVYLDLELPSDLRKLEEPELFFAAGRDKHFCLDEIQRIPELFAPLRSIIDSGKRNGQFLLLGSASWELIRQSSESLAGRIAYLELTPFLLPEITQAGHPDPLQTSGCEAVFPTVCLPEMKKHQGDGGKTSSEPFLNGTSRNSVFIFPPTQSSGYGRCAPIIRDNS